MPLYTFVTMKKYGLQVLCCCMNQQTSAPKVMASAALRNGLEMAKSYTRCPKISANPPPPPSFLNLWCPFIIQSRYIESFDKKKTKKTVTAIGAPYK